MIGKTISHYEVLVELGRGGMDIVHKFRDTKLDRRVALKFLPGRLLRDQEAGSRFLHEAKATWLSDHPNIIAICEKDGLEIECSTYTEQVEGRRIKQLLLVTDSSQTDPGSP
ncbi:MAG: hypothetical protein WBC88_08375 [Candidatus Zixiibacteriota bacterium]